MTAGDNNDVFIIQAADNNTAVYELWGDRNDVDIDQVSDNNTARFNGRGTPPAPGGGVSDNTVDVDQGGLGGHSITGYFATGSSDNTIRVNQTGTGNAVAGDFGPGGDAGLFVDGDNNSISITQSGIGNVTMASAIGDSNVSAVTQQ